MVRTIRTVLLSVGMLLLASPAGLAQTPELPSVLQPVPGASSQFPSGSFYVGPGRDFSATLEDRNDSVLVGNPYLDGPRNNLGWFATVDLDVVGSHIHNKLTNTVAVGDMTDQVMLPTANLNWTVSPRF